jgi:hypothetical protein
MRQSCKVDANGVRQLTEYAGLDLPLERAANIVPGLQQILDADVPIAGLDLATLTAVGDLWTQEEPGYDEC